MLIAKVINKNRNKVGILAFSIECLVLNYYEAFVTCTFHKNYMEILYM